MLRYFSVIVSQDFPHQHQHWFLVKSNTNLSMFFHFNYCFLFLLLMIETIMGHFHDYSWVSWIESYRGLYQLLNKTSASFGETRSRSSSGCSSLTSRTANIFYSPSFHPLDWFPSQSSLPFYYLDQGLLFHLQPKRWSSQWQPAYFPVFLSCCFFIWLFAHQFLPPYSL